MRDVKELNVIQTTIVLMIMLARILDVFMSAAMIINVLPMLFVQLETITLNVIVQKHYQMVTHTATAIR